jgi:hypothetical protein
LQTAIVFLVVNRHHDALVQVNKVLNTDKSLRSTQTDSLAGILTLIIHLELGNDDYLGYAVRSIERKFKAGKKLYKLERLMIDFIKKWIRANAVEKKKILEDFRDQVDQLKQDKFEIELLLFFDLAAWCERKLK